MKFSLPLEVFLESKLSARVIRFFLRHDAVMSEREIASILDISHMSVNRALKALSEVHFVDFVKVGNAHAWRVNSKSYAFKVFTQALAPLKTSLSSLDALQKTIRDILPHSLVKKAVLFGSVAHGRENSSSDIDLYLEVGNSAEKKKLSPYLDELNLVCLDLFGNRISPYVVTTEESRHKNHASIVSAVESGVVLRLHGAKRNIS
jgi:predicted nucleotidyltransferase